MSTLIIKNHIINAPMLDIIQQIKSELTNGKLKDIQDKGNNIRVTCPFHNSGMERMPDCEVYCGDSEDIEYGTAHCFACGTTASLAKFVGECFDLDEEFGKDWLVERFGNTLVEKELNLPPLVLNKQEEHLDESVLDSFESWHPYLATRKLSPEVCKKFKVCYDPKTKCIVFPVWDEHNKLKFLTRRSVVGKKFIIDANVEKPVYLLNYIKKNNIDEVIVCESQINALYCQTLGYNAIALFGTGSKYQYDILKHSGIRHYILAFDGDEAGDKGAKRFESTLNNSCFVTKLQVPRGKDINDLSKEEVDNLLKDVAKK